MRNTCQKIVPTSTPGMIYCAEPSDFMIRKVPDDLETDRYYCWVHAMQFIADTHNHGV